MNDLIVGSVVGLYFAALVMSVHYSCQNSQPAERLASELVESPVVAAGWRELADAVYGPEEVRDVEAH